MRTKLLISVLSILSLMVLGCGNSVEDFVITNQQVAQNNGNLAVNFSRTNITAQTTQQNFANADQYVVTLLDGNGNVVAEQEVNADLANDTQTVTFNNVPEGDYTVVISSFLNGVLTDQVSRAAVSIQDEVTTTIGTGTTETFSDFTGTFVAEAPVLAQTNGFYRVALLGAFLDPEQVTILVNGNEVTIDRTTGPISNYVAQASGTTRVQVQTTAELEMQTTEPPIVLLDETFTLTGGQSATIAITGEGFAMVEVASQQTGLEMNVITDDTTPTAGQVNVRFVNALTGNFFTDPLSLDAEVGEANEIELTGSAAPVAATAYSPVTVSELVGGDRLELENDQGADIFFGTDNLPILQTEEPTPLTYDGFVNILSGLQTSGGNVSVFFAGSGIRFDSAFIVTIDAVPGGMSEGVMFTLVADD